MNLGVRRQLSMRLLRRGVPAAGTVPSARLVRLLLLHLYQFLLVVRMLDLPWKWLLVLLGLSLGLLVQVRVGAVYLVDLALLRVCGILEFVVFRGGVEAVWHVETLAWTVSIIRLVMRVNSMIRVRTMVRTVEHITLCTIKSSIVLKSRCVLHRKLFRIKWALRSKGIILT